MWWHEWLRLLRASVILRRWLDSTHATALGTASSPSFSSAYDPIDLTSAMEVQSDSELQ